VVSTNSVGYDHVDASYLKQYGIQLGHTPDVLTDATADFTVGLVLAACRRLGEVGSLHNTSM
jgi:lactate dehydrogenase-like 2-hydroxyacid dehydrogenase